MTRAEMDRALQRLFPLLADALTPAQVDDVTALWGQGEWDLAIDLAARLVVERGAPIRAPLHDLLAALVAASEHAALHDPSALARLRAAG